MNQNYPGFDIIDFTAVIFILMMFSPLMALHLMPGPSKS